MADEDGTEELGWSPHRGKHVANSKVPWRDVVESTKHGDAKYRNDLGCSIEEFERRVWKEGTPAANGRNWRVMEFDEVIGDTQ